jgi:DNA topoisomerase-2
VWSFDDAKRMMRVTDLPINVWTDDYKVFSEKMLMDKESPLQDIVYAHDDITVDIQFIFKRNEYETFKNMDEDKLVKMFKLSSKLSETNMYLFNAEGKLQYFETVSDILQYYYQLRLMMYVCRKRAMIDQLKYEMLILANKAKFIGHVKQGKISLRTMTDQSLLKALQQEFDKDPRSSGDGFSQYDYLVSMNYRAFTNENAQRMEDLVKAKQHEIEILEATKPETMWETDIDTIIDTLDAQEIKAPKKAAKRTMRIKTKK